MAAYEDYGYVELRSAVQDGEIQKEFIVELIQRDDEETGRRLHMYNELLIDLFEQYIEGQVARYDCADMPGGTQDDLRQEAYAVLLDCANSYDDTVGNCFFEYASKHIKWAVTDAFYSMKGKKRVHCKANADNHRERADKYYQSRREPLSLDAELGWCEWFQDEDFWNQGVRPKLRARNILEQFSTGNYVEDSVTFDDALSHLPDALKKLSEKESGILMDRYGYRQKWEDIAKKYGICRKSAQNIANRAMEKVRFSIA